MKYCLDANVFIEAHRRYYAFDIAPPFWLALEKWGRQQVVCSPMAVYNELVGQRDALANWCRTSGSVLFVGPDIKTYSQYQVAAQHVTSRYQPQLVQSFLAGADLWVIAYAAAHNLTVVTMEVFRQETVDRKTGRVGGKKIQIPNVCKHLGVPTCNTFDLLRNLNFSF